MTEHPPFDLKLAKKISFQRFLHKHYIWLFVLIGCIEGLFFVFAIPPWQHYDEPTHFEYAWLIANKNHFPVLNEFDQDMRRAVAVSMLAHNFFKDLSFRPDLESTNEPIWIGITQTNDPPLYYLFVSFALRLFKSIDITNQLYVARLVSLFFYLIIILLSWKLIGDLSPIDHPLRWMVPLSLVLIPAIPDMLTSVNNDVGAALFFTFFLWMVVRFLLIKSSWQNLIILLTAAGLCFFTKNTVVIAPFIAILVIILKLPLLFQRLFISSRFLQRVRNSWTRVLLIVGILVTTVFLVIMFRWGDPAYWYHQPFMNFLGRTKNSAAPLGSYSIQIPFTIPQILPRMIQVIPVETCRQLRGKTVTLGAWVWADTPLKTRTPIFEDPDNNQSEFNLIDVGRNPKYYSITFTINSGVNRGHILLSPHVNLNQTDVEADVYYDGIVLIEGAYSADTIPVFFDPNGSQGRWGDITFSNLLHNGSAEQAWPGIRTSVDNYLSKYTPIRPSLVLNSLLFTSSSAWYYQESAKNIFISFWGKFGWGNVPLLGNHTYYFLGIFTLISLLFFGLTLLKSIRNFSIIRPSLKAVGLVFFISCTFICLTAVVRGLPAIIGGYVFIPSARYIFPVIFPLLMTLNIGWLEISYQSKRWLCAPLWFSFSFLLFFYLALNLLSWVSLFSFFY